MTSADRLDLAAEARAHVARVIALLEKPTLEALDESAAEISAAAARIEQIREDGGASPGSATLKSTIAGMRKDLRRAGVLLRRAWEFRRNLGEPQPGYTEKGELKSQPAPARHWALEG